jgi:predicted DNA binding CopG/RHH family protein
MGSKLVAMTLRLPPELMKDIDARAARHGLRRTAWIVKALAFMVASPEQTTTVRQKL